MENEIVGLQEKQEISDIIYNELYPTGSKPGIYFIWSL